MNADLDYIRGQFPAFSEPKLNGWGFFENAGGSYPCKQFIEKLTSFYLENKVQPYYPYPASQKAGSLMDEGYEKISAYLGVGPEDIHFGPSTTQNVYVVANAIQPLLKPGCDIIVSCQDHEANSGAWRSLEKKGYTIIDWHVNPDTGILEKEGLESLLSEKTGLVAFPHCSNVIGHINHVQDFCNLIHEFDALSVVDGVGYAPHGFPDLSNLGADIYFFSLYKTFGPHLGLMYVNRELTLNMENQSHYFKDGIVRSMITPAGPDHAQVAASSGIIDYFDLVYNHHFKLEQPPVKRSAALRKLFRDHETALLKRFLEFLNSRSDIRIVGPDSSENRLPIVSIVPENKSISEVYKQLVDKKLMLGMGHFYAVRPLIDMGIPVDPGVLRFSFVHYTSSEEIDQLIAGLDFALGKG